jgi:hypothetical protein
VTIVITGKILQGMYESDSPPSSSSQRPTAPSSSSRKPSAWVTHEYEERKKEKDTPDITKKRFKEEEDKLIKKYEERKKWFKEKGKEGDWDKYIEGKSRERDKDLKELKKMLEKKGLQGIGLDKNPKWYIKPKGDDKDKAKDKAKDEAEKPEKKAEKAKDPSQTTMAEKIKSALLGKTLAAARKREKQKSAAGAGGQAVIMAPGTTLGPAATPAAVVPERGPGWEVSQDPTTAAGLAKSAGNAEALARGLGR